MEDMDESSRTELDSHANMPVIGRMCTSCQKLVKVLMLHLLLQMTSLLGWSWQMQH